MPARASPPPETTAARCVYRGRRAPQPPYGTAHRASPPPPRPAPPDDLPPPPPPHPRTLPPPPPAIHVQAAQRLERFLNLIELHRGRPIAPRVVENVAA